MLVFYLICIVNTSIVTGIVPTAWKHALVIPLFKSGDVSDFNNFTPVSLLSLIPKVLENYWPINLLISWKLRKLCDLILDMDFTQKYPQKLLSLSLQTKHTIIWTK